MLNELYLDSNKLTTLDVSQNTKLWNLNCDSNKLTVLDVSSNELLEGLSCKNNLLTSLDVSQNKALKWFNCSLNQISSLDLSENFQLEDIDCSSNQLTSLNLKNGSNYTISLINTSTSFKNNPNLICIKVDYVGYSNVNWLDLKDATAEYNYYCGADDRYTLIPDPNFEQKLIDLGIDTDGKNGQVLTSSIENLISLDVSKSNIKDLTGISYFRGLKTLDCSSNQLTSLDVSRMSGSGLNSLNCSSNQLTNLILPTGHSLNSLNCSSNLLTSFTANYGLNYLDCSSNLLTYLNIDNFYSFAISPPWDSRSNFRDNYLTCIQVSDIDYFNTNLSNSKDDIASYSNNCAISNIEEYTYIYDLNFEQKLINLGIDTDGLNGKVLTKNIIKITSLDVSSSNIQNLGGIENFLSLKNLNCSSNQISNLLNLSKNKKLEYINCSKNNLSNLITDNLSLINLNCSFNKLKRLDVTVNKNLTNLDCSSNLLDFLYLNNNNNINLSPNSNFKNNPNLTCIQVDDATYANTNWSNMKDATANYNIYCSGEQLTAIPDANFEQKLIYMGIDKDGLNGKVLTSSINKVLELNVSRSNIKDLTGIQDFVALTRLECYENQLESLALPINGELDYLDCHSNNLKSLDISKNKELTHVICHSNQIENLDTSSNTILERLTCNNNKFTSLDVSKNTFLNTLEFGFNLLTNIDVSNNLYLSIFSCKSNLLTNLDLSKNKSLLTLDVSLNKLTDLDISENDALENLNCSSNQLSMLDLSKKKDLIKIDCSSNQLTSLNLKNGNNRNMYYVGFYDNPKLSCIQVDDEGYSYANWKYRKDETASYSENCSEEKFTSIPDANFEDKLIALGIDIDGKNGKISTNRIKDIYALDVSNSSISDLTGIEDFASLDDLKCFENSLKTLDVSKNLLLKGLDCSSNQLTNLNVKNGFNRYWYMSNSFKNNPNLTCIQVDDVTYANTSLVGYKDATATYSVNCGALTLPTNNFTEMARNMLVYPNPNLGSFEIILPTSTKKETIGLYTLGGRLLSNKIYTVENGKVQISLEGEVTGIYVAKVEGTQNYVKIIKK